MNSKKAFFVTIVLASLLAAYSILLRPKLVMTMNGQRQHFEAMLNKEILGLKLAKDHIDVYFRQVCRDDPKVVKDSNVHDYKRIPLGAVFCMRHERHVTSWMSLNEIKPDGVTISYHSEFNERSFGKNLLRIDEGSFYFSTAHQ